MTQEERDSAAQGHAVGSAVEFELASGFPHVQFSECFSGVSKCAHAHTHTDREGFPVIEFLLLKQKIKQNFNYLVLTCLNL